MHTESKNRLEKKQVVNEIKAMFKSSEAIYVAEYRGLTVENMNEFRNKATDLGVELKVFKNRLFKIATDKKFEQLYSHLVGPNIYVFAKENGILGAKLIKDFADEYPALVIKAGIFENKVIDAAGVIAVANLPTYEEALTILASSLLGPLRQVALSFKLLADENKLPAA